MMEWDESAKGWDDDPAVRTYAAGAFERLTALLPEYDQRLGDARVLDFGCGTGLLTEAMAPEARSIVALDLSPKMIEVLDRKVEREGWTHVTTVVGTLDDARAESRPAGFGPPFDLIVCSSVCAFLPDYPSIAKSLAGLLAPGGVFVQFDWERDDSADEPFGLTRGEIETVLDHARLVEIKVETAFDRTVGEMTMAPLLGAGRAR